MGWFKKLVKADEERSGDTEISGDMTITGSLDVSGASLFTVGAVAGAVDMGSADSLQLPSGPGSAVSLDGEFSFGSYSGSSGLFVRSSGSTLFFAGAAI